MRPGGNDRRHAAVAMIAVAVLLLAGCVSGVEEETAPASGVGWAVQPDVDDPYRFDVLVTEETGGGDPIANATVVLFRNRMMENPADAYYLSDDEVPRDGVLDLTASHAFEVLAVGRSDGDGRVVGLVEDEPEGRPRVSVAVGDVPGWTDEVVLIAAGAGGNPMRATTRTPSDFWEQGGPPLTVPLYRQHKQVHLAGEINVSLSTAGAAPGAPVLGRPAWEARDLDFGAATHEYSFRLKGLDLALRWNNTAADHGDLHIMAGNHGGEKFHGPDRRNPPASGSQVEHLRATIDDRHRSLVFRVGAATNSTVAAEEGLPWQIRGEASFLGARVVLPAAP